MYDRPTVMDAPNPAQSFSVNISTFFPRNDWRTNVIENSITFRGVPFTIFAFTNFEDVPLTLEGPVVFTFYMPPRIHNNLIINLFAPPM